ncbi:DUF3995 domain-containing protein [Phenylobacterium sp.]|uniref:DUF3995 domain-containing protein n=1 Tax=Phenylobacterium sp. TaxID=1871053 RepID=UPI00374CC5E0
MGLAVTLLLAGVILAIAALHLSWAFGSDWPTPRGELAIYVTPGTRRPGAAITIGVAAAIALAGLIVLAFRAPLTWPWNMASAAGYFGVMLVFLVRGMAGYFPALWRVSQGRPFYRLNRIYYSPLCLVIAGGLAANVLIR